jgi:signal transduction histidine kinase
VAGAIHDDALQSMAVVQLRLGLLGRRLERPDDRALVAELEDVVGAAIGRLRQLIAGLVPPDPAGAP